MTRRSLFVRRCSPVRLSWARGFYRLLRWASRYRSCCLRSGCGRPQLASAFYCAFAYYLSALWSVPVVARNFFGPNAGLIDGIVLWLVASVLLAAAVAIGLVRLRQICAVARTHRSARVDCAAARTDRMGIADGSGRPSISRDWLRRLCPHPIPSGLSGSFPQTNSRVRGCSCCWVQRDSPRIAGTSNRLAGHRHPVRRRCARACGSPA